MCVCSFVFFSQSGQLVGLTPVLAACHLIYVFSVVLHCISIHAVANKVLSLFLGHFQTASDYKNANDHLLRSSRPLWNNGQPCCFRSVVVLRGGVTGPTPNRPPFSTWLGTGSGGGNDHCVQKQTGQRL